MLQQFTFSIRENFICMLSITGFLFVVMLMMALNLSKEKIHEEKKIGNLFHLLIWLQMGALLFYGMSQILCIYQLSNVLMMIDLAVSGLLCAASGTLLMIYIHLAVLGGDYKVPLLGSVTCINLLGLISEGLRAAALLDKDVSAIQGIFYYVGIAVVLLFAGFFLILLLKGKDKKIPSVDLTLWCAFCFPQIAYFILFYGQMPMVFIYVFAIVLSYISIYQHSVMDYYLKECGISFDAEQNNVERMSQSLSKVQPILLRKMVSLIRTLCDVDGDQAALATQRLSLYVQDCICCPDENKLIPLKEELDHIKHFIDIHRLLDGKKIQVEYDTPYKDFLVPAYSIEMLVQSALTYGILKKEYGGVIRILSRDYDDEWVIQVLDNGPGYDMNQVSIQEITDYDYTQLSYRLMQHLQATMKIQTQVGRGLSVTIRIPKGGNLHAE